MFTAEEYRTAAKVVRSLDIVRASHLDVLAKKQEEVEQYASDLGMVGRANYPEDRGMLLLNKLIEDGWTPPEGLF